MRSFPRLLDVNAEWIGGAGRPASPFYDYMAVLDSMARAFAASATAIAFASLPTDGSPGATRFVSDGRKAGEGAGSGTGVLTYWDGTHWCACDTSLPVAV